MKLLNELLELSEAESGILQLKKQWHDLREVISDVVEVYEYIAEEKNIHFHIDYQAPVYAMVDPSRFHQVISNILENAVKYSPHHNEIQIRITRNDHSAAVVVEDQGMGITEDELDKIWIRGYRCSGTNPHKNGTTVFSSLYQYSWRCIFFYWFGIYVLFGLRKYDKNSACVFQKITDNRKICSFNRSRIFPCFNN